jgi:HNH endonuclease/NUMOD4 motif
MYYIVPMIETWRAVLGYEDWYEVSDLGRCRVLKMPGKGRKRKPYPMILKPLRYRKGYLKIHLGSCQGTRSSRRLFLHRIIWEAFNGPIPSGMTINHLDGDSSNNRITNLELADFVRQYHHAVSLGLVYHPTKAGPRKPSMTAERVRELRTLHKLGWTLDAIAGRYGISPSNVRWILIGRTWGHVH